MADDRQQGDITPAPAAAFPADEPGKAVVKTNPVPAASNPKQLAVPLAPPPIPSTLPGASVIYGMAASGLLVIAIYFLFIGRWFTGALVLLPAACFLGFALYFLQNQKE